MIDLPPPPPVLLVKLRSWLWQQWLFSRLVFSGLKLKFVRQHLEWVCQKYSYPCPVTAKCSTRLNYSRHRQACWLLFSFHREMTCVVHVTYCLTDDRCVRFCMLGILWDWSSHHVTHRFTLQPFSGLLSRLCRLHWDNVNSGCVGTGPTVTVTVTVIFSWWKSRVHSS